MENQCEYKMPSVQCPTEKSPLEKAEVWSYQIKEVGSDDHIIWMSFTLTTDMGEFTGEEVEMEHETEADVLIRAMLKPEFGNLLKERLIFHNEGIV